MITVFTPSYNRKKELKLLYESLLKQNTKNFEWLIVDDGSNDDTSKYIDKLKSKNIININYVYKMNGGKQSAYNKGLDEARGDIFLCIDSDDILKENILKSIEDDFSKISDNDELAGIMYVQGFINNKSKIIGTAFKNNGLIDTYYNIYNKHGIKGDKLIVLKTKVAKEYYFPIIEGEKFVPEALVFNRISHKYKLLCSNVVASYKEYLEGGYTDNYFSLARRNPKGNMLYFKELYAFNKSFYNVYGYILFGIYAKYNFYDILKEHPAKIKLLLLYLPTRVMAFVKRRKK